MGTRQDTLDWISAQECQLSGGVGLEADGAEVVARGEADVGVEGRRKVPKQCNGWLGAAFFDALDLIGGHVGALGEVGDAEAKGDPPIIDRLPEPPRIHVDDAARQTLPALGVPPGVTIVADDRAAQPGSPR